MFTSTLLALSAALPVALSQTLKNETVLGVYMFHRHGDRTAKITAPSNLTDLGYLQVYTSGEYYRDRYIVTDAPYRISGINTDLVLQTQIQASAPIDTVLQNSATGFLQALYPPVGSGLDTETLRNGTTITSPMQGYQLIPLGVAESGSGSEDSTWLQGTTDCAKAEISSNDYFVSNEYNHMLHSTQDFYQRLVPVLVGEFNSTTATFENAYESKSTFSCRRKRQTVVANFCPLSLRLHQRSRNPQQNNPTQWSPHRLNSLPASHFSRQP